MPDLASMRVAANVHRLGRGVGLDLIRAVVGLGGQVAGCDLKQRGRDWLQLRRLDLADRAHRDDLAVNWSMTGLTSA
jgi:hypothetical protein